MVLRCERYGFARQYHTFCRVKRILLQGQTERIDYSLIINEIELDRRTQCDGKLFVQKDDLFLQT